MVVIHAISNSIDDKKKDYDQKNDDDKKNLIGHLQNVSGGLRGRVGRDLGVCGWCSWTQFRVHGSRKFASVKEGSTWQ